MDVNGVPMARHELILSEDVTTGSRMFFMQVSDLFNDIFCKC